jgi:hypothetical protein
MPPPALPHGPCTTRRLKAWLPLRFDGSVPNDRRAATTGARPAPDPLFIQEVTS